MSRTTLGTESGLAVLLGTGLLLAAAGEAQAQAPPVCFARPEMLRLLEGQFGERPSALGLADSGSVLELVAAADGRTWTLVSTDPEGRSCMVATGRWWSVLPPEGPGLESAFRPGAVGRR